MIKTRCAICNVDNNKVLFKANFKLSDLNSKTFSARRIPDRKHYRIVECKNCGLVYSNPVLEAGKIEKLYKKSAYTYGEYENELTITYSKYLKQAIKYVVKKDNFLEIGCGNGFFLKEAKKLGFKKVFGIEPGKETVAKADKQLKKHIIVDIFKKDQFKKNYFDFICLFQVFDHIPDPNNFLKTLFEILKPGGCVLCINHNVSSYSAKILGERSPIFDIEHTYLYNKKTLKLIFEKNRFNTLQILDVLNYYPVSYWFKMLPMPNSIKSLGFKILNTYGLDFMFWLKAGNIAIVANKINITNP